MNQPRYQQIVNKKDISFCAAHFTELKPLRFPYELYTNIHFILTFLHFICALLCHIILHYFENCNFTILKVGEYCVTDLLASIKVVI